MLTGINFGNGLPRALVTPGVPVTSVAQIESYGLLTSMEAGAQRSTALELFQKVYGQAIGTGPVMDYIRQTGIDALKGAEILKQAPAKYSSSVEYADNAIAQSLKGAAQVHLADLGARVLYTQQGGYDVHSNELPTQQQLWTDLSGGLSDFFADLREHDASENVVVLIFTEFGRRVLDNGNGTDHGSGGGAFLIGDRVAGGMYAEYPSLAPEKQLDGDLQFNYDYRGMYSSILEPVAWAGPGPDSGRYVRADRLLRVSAEMTTSAKTNQVYIRVGHYYLKTIGVHGALGGRSFAFPVDVAWDSKGRLYVANGDAGNPRITMLNLDEDYFGEFGSPGDGDRKRRHSHVHRHRQHRHPVRVRPAGPPREQVRHRGEYHWQVGRVWKRRRAP